MARWRSPRATCRETIRAGGSLGERSGWIDFAPREDGLIVIGVTIDGEPALALVDTGFETMTLTKRFAQALILR